MSVRALFADVFPGRSNCQVIILWSYCRLFVYDAQLTPSTGVTANLNITYKRPTVSNGFYVIRAQPLPEGVANDRPGKSTDSKGYVAATLETLDGKVCVEATALYVSPKGFEVKEIYEGF